MNNQHNIITPWGKRRENLPQKKIKEAIQTRQQQSNPPKQGRKLLKYLLSTKAVVTFLIGVVSFLFVVYPRISVYPGESLDPYNPLATPFLIKNDGYLPIRDVHYSLTPRNVKIIKSDGTTGYIAAENDEKMFVINPLPKKIPILESNKITTIFVPFFKWPVKSADIYINLTYKPLVPFTFSQRHRFITMTKKKTGEYIWLEDYSQK